MTVLRFALVLTAALPLSAVVAQENTAGSRSLVADSKTAAPGVPAPAAAPAPAKPVSVMMRGDIAMARKFYREAIDYFRSIRPEQALVWNKIGIAYHHLGEMDQAKKAYERAIKLDKRYAEAINNLGTVHYARHSFRRAVSQYNKALKLAPRSAGMWSNLGTAWFAR